MHNEPNGRWSPDAVQRIASQLSIRTEEPAPYLNAFLAAVETLGAHHGFNPQDICKVEAAWEYSDPDEDESGFVVRLLDQRVFYLETRKTRSGSQTVLAVHQLSGNAEWQDAPASPTYGAVGWIEEPDEVNLFLQRMREPRT